jgi:hypothetical protein
MVYAAIAPEAALTATFGESLNGPLALIIVRNWGALITLVGLMLIYGAFHPSVRPLVLTVAAVSKAVFIGLVLSQGGRYLGHQAGVAVAVDAVMVLVFGWFAGDTQSGHSVLSVPAGAPDRNAVLFWSIRARVCDECSVQPRSPRRFCADRYAEIATNALATVPRDCQH